MRKYMYFILLIMIIFTSSALAYVDEMAMVEFDYIQEEFLPAGYGITFAKLDDFNADGIDEYWLVAQTKVDGREISKIFIFSKFEGFFEKVWESQELPGVNGHLAELSRIDENYYIVVSTLVKEKSQRQLWVFHWDLGQQIGTLINEPIFSDQIISFYRNDQKFFKDIPLDKQIFLTRHNQEDGIFFKAYMLQDGDLVFAADHLYKKEEPVVQTMEEQYPAIDSVLQSTYPGYKVEQVEYLDQGLSLVKIKSEAGQELWIVVEQMEGEKVVIWYSLDDRFSSHDYLFEYVDVDRDGYLEIVMSDSDLFEYEFIYIISLQSDRPRLVSPVKDDGSTPIVQLNQGNYFSFQDVNGDGFFDLITYMALDLKDIWIWNSQLGQFDFSESVVESQ